MWFGIHLNKEVTLRQNFISWFMKISRKEFRLLIIVILLAFNSLQGSAQMHIDGTFGKGISFTPQDSSFLVKFGFRFQTLYVGRSFENSNSWEENLLIRRSRLKFDGFVFAPNVEYKVELGLSNRDTRSGQIPQSGNTANIILDAVLKWKFAPNWALWAGQTKLPGNRERVISSQKLQFADRSLVNSRFNLDRDIGLQLRHKSKLGSMVIKEAIAISTGEGRDITSINEFDGRQYTGRLELLPFGEFTSKGDYFGADLKREPTPKLSIGVTGDFNNKTVRSRGNLGSFLSDADGNPISSDLTTIFVDAIFKYKGWSIASEYVNRNTSSKVDGFGYGTGITASTGFLFSNNFEIAGRYTTISPISNSSSISETDEYMIGLSKYVKGHSLKVQSDLSYTNVETGNNFIMFRLQFELAI